MTFKAVILLVFNAILIRTESKVQIQEPTREIICMMFTVIGIQARVLFALIAIPVLPHLHRLALVSAVTVMVQMYTDNKWKLK